MSKNKKESLQQNIHTSLESGNNSNSTSLFEREAVDGTPFEIITTEKGSMLTWGKFQITEFTETKEECLKLLKTDIWKIIAVYTLSVIERQKEMDLAKKNMDAHAKANPELVMKQVEKQIKNQVKKMIVYILQ